MRYFYTICLLLSSLFIYKPTLAAEQPIKYAFFIPPNAFQSNLEDDYTEDSDYQTQEKTISKQTVAPTKKTPQITKKSTTSIPQRKTVVKQLPVKNSVKKTKPQAVSNKSDSIRRVQPQEPSFKAKAPSIVTRKNQTIENIPFKEFQTKSIDEMLKTIPYADTTAPQYKQLYYLYALDLAVLYNTGALPPNFKQEETLAKANSFQHIKYED